MLYYAEDKLIQAIGPFGVVGSVQRHYSTGGFYRSLIDINSSQIGSSILPGQCQAFLTSSREFVWFVQQWDVVPKTGGDFNVPLVSLENKKVYPAKVRGLNLALLGLSDSPTAVTVKWREGLIRHGSLANYGYLDPTIPCLRPGFGQTILSDLNRPLQSETVVTNHLGLINATANSPAFWGPLGRLMSMAFHVDPELAAKYDASSSKKKQKSLNSQDYEEIPTYPPYDVYVDNSGY